MAPDPTPQSGVSCLTPENLHEDWVLFEAGAIKTPDLGAYTLLIDLDPSDVVQVSGTPSYLQLEWMREGRRLEHCPHRSCVGLHTSSTLT